MSFRVKLLPALSILLLTYLLSSPVKAADEFLSDYDIIYQVDEAGVTQVTQQVGLINQTERFYATEYIMKLSTTDIFEVKATDPLGPVAVSLTKDEDTTVINLTFNDKVVGKGARLDWQLSYLTKEYAQKIGRIWEVDIPGLIDAAAINQLNLKLLVPSSFGQPAYIFPQPQSSEVVQGMATYSFSKESYLNHGVSAAFGEFQLFQFTLDYHLKNPNLYPITMKVALPPDTPRQSIILEGLEPPPVNINLDQDGNWLAEYQLAAGGGVDIVAQGIVKLFSKPKTKTIPILSETDRHDYLMAQKYWEVDNPEIQALVKNLDDPEKIYNYVVSALTYEESRLEGDLYRMGASAALQSPQSAVCMEFTDLFIALARAAGIPAREINGYAYTRDPRRRPLSLARLSGDVLHSWPEYYDSEQGWIPVDPTWESTTRGRDYFHNFDLNHVVFAIHGLDSDWPPPAGAYKYDASHQNDVQLQFSKTDPAGYKEPVVKFNLPQKVISGLPISGKIIVENQGNILYPQANLLLKSNFFTIAEREDSELPQIPPLGWISLPISIRSHRITKTVVKGIDAEYDGQTFTHQLVVQPFFLVNLPVLIIGGGAFLGLSTLFIARRARGLFI